MHDAEYRLQKKDVALRTALRTSAARAVLMRPMSAVTRAETVTVVVTIAMAVIVVVMVGVVALRPVAVLVIAKLLDKNKVVSTAARLLGSVTVAVAIIEPVTGSIAVRIRKTIVVLVSFRVANRGVAVLLLDCRCGNGQTRHSRRGRRGSTAGYGTDEQPV